MDKAVVLFSGGLDSTSLLGILIKEGYSVIPFSVDYGQRHARELHAAQEVISYYGLEHRHIVLRVPQLKGIMIGSSQTDDHVEVPEGHYADETMKQTVVPNRNMILISLAMAAALSYNYDTVAFAAHAGDHPIYPDCRPAFIYRMRSVMEIASDRSVILIAPFQTLSKGEILKHVRAMGADVPFHLTFSCYKGELHHCGKCGTCVERREAFVQAGMEDPTVYTS